MLKAFFLRWLISSSFLIIYTAGTQHYREREKCGRKKGMVKLLFTLREQWGKWNTLHGVFSIVLSPVVVTVCFGCWDSGCVPGGL